MATIEQVKNGIARYLDEKLIPNLSDEIAIKIMAGSYCALVLHNLDKKIERISENPALQLTGAFDDKGNVDVDKLGDAIKGQMKKYNLCLDDLLLGKLSMLKGHVNAINFTTDDIDDIKKYIKGE